MKTNIRKAIALTVCAIVLVVATVFATVAYFTSKASVQNSFSIGKVKITLDEQKVGLDGKPVSPASRISTGNQYKLVPSVKCTKDPTVHVESGSESAWIFVKVENGISAIEDGTTIAQQITNNGWTLVSGKTDIYYKSYDAANPVADHKVFGDFTVKSTETDTTLSSYASAKINVTAVAIQKAGFNDVNAAFVEASKKF